MTDKSLVLALVNPSKTFLRELFVQQGMPKHIVHEMTYKNLLSQAYHLDLCVLIDRKLAIRELIDKGVIHSYILPGVSSEGLFEWLDDIRNGKIANVNQELIDWHNRLVPYHYQIDAMWADFKNCGVSNQLIDEAQTKLSYMDVSSMSCQMQMYPTTNSLEIEKRIRHRIELLNRDNSRI
jgi:hypothetical protein